MLSLSAPNNSDSAEAAARLQPLDRRWAERTPTSQTCQPDEQPSPRPGSTSRHSELAPSQLLAIWVIGADGRLVGGVFSSELLRAEPVASVTSLIETRIPVISPQTELPEVARLMADYNLLAIPVIDDDEKPLGVVAFDDVLELLIPEEWRRRAGDARE